MLLSLFRRTGTAKMEAYFLQLEHLAICRASCSVIRGAAGMSNWINDFLTSLALHIIP